MKDLTQDPEAIEWLGVRYKTILTPEQSGGAMSIVDSLSPVGQRARQGMSTTARTKPS